MLASGLALGGAAPVGAAPKPAPMVEIDLNGAWQFRAAESGRPWCEARVPGCNYTDLLAANLIPDPFVSDNEALLQRLDGTNWEYRTTFRVTAEALRRQQIDLIADGLDTLAAVR